MDAILMIDQNILLWLQENVRNNFLNSFFIFITSLGNSGMIWIITALVLTIPEKTRRIGILTLTALAMSFLINNVILKNIVARTRPYEVIDTLRILIAKPKDFSFPSGHTGSSFAAAVVIFLGLPKRFSFIAVVLAALIGFSRLYIGVHYPTDVLAGMVIGISIAIAVYFVGNKVVSKRASLLNQTNGK